jgi:hypothetical protein
MMGIGVEASLAGRLAVEAARDFNAVRTGEGGTLLEKSVVLLERVAPEIDSLEARLAVIDQHRDHIHADGLIPPLKAAVRDLTSSGGVRELVWTTAGLRCCAFSRSTGRGPIWCQPQNNAEPPTGGLFVYGLVTVREGHIDDMFFEDAIAFGDRWMKAGNYVEPPGPLANYLLKDWSWNLALANWSPDFPTAARQAQWFFEAGGGRPVDGVIGIDVTTLEKLLNVTGPVDVPEYSVRVTSGNALDVIEANTRSPAHPGDDRKAIVALIADEVMDQVLHAKPSQWSPLLDALEEVGDGKDLLIYLNNANEERLVREMGWDGGLRGSDGDYLMVVDASVNSTKLNIAMEQSLHLDVTLDELGNAHHRLTLSYLNDLPRWQQGRDPELVRRLMLGGTYGGYVRLLTPRDARVGHGAGRPRRRSRGGWQDRLGCFSPPGQRRPRDRVRLPRLQRSGRPPQYRPLIQKQPGQQTIPAAGGYPDAEDRAATQRRSVFAG